jgi:hypothetical protein
VLATDELKGCDIGEKGPRSIDPTTETLDFFNGIKRMPVRLTEPGG